MSAYLERSTGGVMLSRVVAYGETEERTRPAGDATHAGPETTPSHDPLPFWASALRRGRLPSSLQVSAIRKEVEKTKADEAGLLERLAEESKVRLHAF